MLEDRNASPRISINMVNLGTIPHCIVSFETVRFRRGEAQRYGDFASSEQNSWTGSARDPTLLNTCAVKTLTTKAKQSLGKSLVGLERGSELVVKWYGVCQGPWLDAPAQVVISAAALSANEFHLQKWSVKPVEKKHPQIWRPSGFAEKRSTPDQVLKPSTRDTEAFNTSYPAVTIFKRNGRRESCSIIEINTKALKHATVSPFSMMELIVDSWNHQKAGSRSQH